MPYRMDSVLLFHARTATAPRETTAEHLLPMGRSLPREAGGAPRRASRARWMLLALLLLPALLAPSHPLAVYSYLLDTGWTRVCEATTGDKAGIDGAPGLSEFLRGPEQVALYRAGLLDDMLDTQGGGLFAIVRDGAGTLRHVPVRTLNSFMPRNLPGHVARWLDRKEFTYLGDPVGLWLRGEEIIAMGHYHPYGGGPSPGDRAAQRLSTVHEVVVSNGLVPTIYLDGALVPYGPPEAVPAGIYRSMRALENGLFMESGVEYEIPNEPSPRLQSFMAYLRDYRGATIRGQSDVAREVRALSREFREQYAPVLGDAKAPSELSENPELMGVLHNLQVVTFWSYRMG